MTIMIKTPEPEIDTTFKHIRDFWRVLTRSGNKLATPLPGRYVMPGGFFQWFFYWDSYFTLLGLIVYGMWELACEITDNFIYEIERFGFVPNYNSPDAVCNSRSQSPFLTATICEVFPYIQDTEWLKRAVHAAEREYRDYWCAQPHLTEIGLSRYIDLGGTGCGTVPDTPHHRAIAESGWDNTPRLGDDATQVVPVDLNCQLYRYERDLAHFCVLLDARGDAQQWQARAKNRRKLINQYLWDNDTGFYWDYDLRSRKRLSGTPRSLASYVALWAEVAKPPQATRMIAHLPVFEQEHGLVACEKGWADGTEHNYPTGWAYSHWYVTAGLRQYGYDTEATRIALKWLRLVASQYIATKSLWERYNVVDPEEPLPGRYRPLRGFGWTNGVFAALLTRIVLGVGPDEHRGRRWASNLPPDWEGKEVRLNLPHYPWPDGTNLEL